MHDRTPPAEMQIELTISVLTSQDDQYIDIDNGNGLGLGCLVT